MKVVITVEANTDTELLEGLISAYNRVHGEMNEAAKAGRYAPNATLRVLDRGVGFSRFGASPTYEIRKEKAHG